MDYYISQSKAPFYNINNSKIRKQFEMNKSNNNNYNNLINHKNIKSFHKELLSGDKKANKKYKTSKNSPKNNNMEILLYKDYSKEIKNNKINLNNDIMRNDNKIHNNELINDIFVNKVKKMTYKKYLQNPLTNRPNSNSLLVSSGNCSDYINKKITNNSNDKRYELSVNNSGLMKTIKKSNSNNNNSNSNSYFYYNNKLFNFH